MIFLNSTLITTATRQHLHARVVVLSGYYAPVESKAVLRSWPRTTLAIWRRPRWSRAFDCDCRADLWRLSCRNRLSKPALNNPDRIYAPACGVLVYRRDSDAELHAVLCWIDDKGGWHYGEEGREIWLTQREIHSAKEIIF